MEHVRIQISKQMRQLMLVDEALRWEGVQEVGGNNRGQLVEIIQRASGLTPGDPWCLAFIQYCLAHVDRVCRLIGSDPSFRKTPAGAHCQTFFNQSPMEIRSKVPVVGSVVVWRIRNSTSGHAGIVTSVGQDKQTFRTVEANTSPSPGVNRDGDGIFRKSHSLKPFANYELMGFVLPWGQ